MNIENLLGELRFNSLKKEADKSSGTEKKRAANNVPAPADSFQKSGVQSAPADDLSQIAIFAQNQPDVRADKVAEVRQKVAEHFYDFTQVQDALAEKIARYLIP
ncbi:MAG: hypothetical protein A2268_05335 [Candidatus Raymondbacteria bacterium RifOxyA12_full_50_37]|uniref:Anti-sigma-28 factor FlgM C-terminal domain-containing protein n=1 Tax=Candidatus Raymondbacteria bacterium RIFOXYD12_FULL_49_13 TaxID=1817890 RepID=A0A1F7FBL6_UNCRA|nr:MAG: hypothetical protein A2268_05335 [Candidatus Raymondbacteria bacterium RifOxyA12_full_50_37]OGJ88987.1 MAG: hypothetical protein A2248_02570 [Candidatus Raymondbacteria bacterium RIFOXYA2_FULL_49_16]OGJ92496.1 MAG: hypothetical protein A2350_15715 [Candidatus Raymondbacteria bacterium RifOxyB12_full_50_8]OGJ97015.1 MAG: hypothetical protein A2453_03990 [Candidatus Raymondbacteria bacterium RIFOXYC2_FULL_50_21]OGK02559.1 MAG: hypothetical protein A2487_15060 [Candidatus Raymondbacteria b